MEIHFTPDNLLLILAAALAVLFDWVPISRSWFEQFSDGQKRGFMAVGVVILAAVIFGLGCAVYISGGPACTQAGLKDIIPVVIMAIVTNQGIHMGTKPSTKQKAVMVAKDQNQKTAGQNL